MVAIRVPKVTFQPPTFNSFEAERLHRKQRLAAAFRLFARFGFSEGIAGHITVRDPEHLDHFWVNSFGMHFSLIRVSDLILVNHKGEVVEGNKPKCTPPVPR
jgi:ribulose-5-phosphate 4-epimerase/fuculose-1-phosphate aldolase